MKEWSNKKHSGSGVETHPPPSGHRMIIRLFWDVAPLACENFATLCANGGGNCSRSHVVKEKPKPAPMGECGKPLTYRNSVVHRIVPNFIMQGVDFVFGNGSGGESIFNGKKFKDEKAGLQLKHDRRGIVSMGNNGKNSNSSQWFVTFQKTPACDGKHVIFGEVISGFEVLDAAERVGTANGDPSADVTITDSGIYAPLVTPGAGYWYDQPDRDCHAGFSPVFMVRPRVAILVPSDSVLEKFRSAIGTKLVPIAIVVDENKENCGKEIALRKAFSLLKTFAIDLIIAAPACSYLLKDIELPSSWKEQGHANSKIKITIDNVIITAKPLNILSTVWNKSWVGKNAQWQCDGVIM